MVILIAQGLFLFNHWRRGVSSHRLPFQKWYVSFYPAMFATADRIIRGYAISYSVCSSDDALDWQAFAINRLKLLAVFV